MENKKKALKLKEWGNDAFKKKKYEIAEQFYSKALEKNLDLRTLWTDRAICRNAMKKHEDALADCISALSIDPKCTKAGVQIVLPKPNFLFGQSDIEIKDTPTICKMWLKSKFLVYGDYFGTRMKRVNYLFPSGRYASEVQLFIEFEYESCM